MECVWVCVRDSVCVRVCVWFKSVTKKLNNKLWAPYCWDVDQILNTKQKDLR